MRNVVVIVVAGLILGICLLTTAQDKKDVEKVKLSHKFTKGQVVKYIFQKETSTTGQSGELLTKSLNFSVCLTIKEINETNSAEIEMVYDEMQVIMKVGGKAWGEWDSKKAKKKYEIYKEDFENVHTYPSIPKLEVATYSNLWKQPLKIRVSQRGEFAIESDLTQVIKSPIPSEIPSGIISETYPCFGPTPTLIREEVKELLSLIFMDFLNDEEKDQWENKTPLVNLFEGDIEGFTEERNLKVKKTKKIGKEECVELRVASVIKQKSEEKGKGEGTFLVDKENGRMLELKWKGTTKTGEDKDLRETRINRELKLLGK